MSPHNVVTQLIWAGGFVALVWMPIFALVVLSRLGALPNRNRKQQANGDTQSDALRDAAVYALLAWFINSMTHQTLSTGLAWVFFGVAMSLSGYGPAGSALRHGGGTRVERGASLETGKASRF